MLSTFFAQDTHMKTAPPKEGELYKILNIEGNTFRLYYGYYEEYERNNPAAEPMPIYPDFLKDPRYTDAGHAFVTKMQDACKHYKGCESESNECAECAYYKHGDELIGICTCPNNKGAPGRQGSAL